MQELEHLITKKIKSTYLRRLFSPIIYLLFLVIIWFYTPMQDLMFPTQLDSSANLTKAALQGDRYIQVDLCNLRFTGYTQNRLGICQGYYYYTMREDKCYLVVLSPRTCEEGLPTIDSVQIYASLETAPQLFDELTTKLAQDLSWTKSGLSQNVSTYLVSEPGFGKTTSFVLLAVYFLSGGYALISIILFLLYAFFPVLSPTCRQLGRYGNRFRLLAQAEEELATLPQLATEDMYITEHFFIAFANKGVSVIPIQEIVWIYKHSTLHKILWYHFSISYTLHITANKHLYIQFPKNMKSDIDGIIDYLSEANHNTLVGFNEKNRTTVQEMTGVKRIADGLIRLLNRKI